MKDGLYKHINWSLVVKIKDDKMVRIVSEPDEEEETLWAVVKWDWYNRALNGWYLDEDDQVYFTYQGEAT